MSGYNLYILESSHILLSKLLNIGSTLNKLTVVIENDNIVDFLDFIELGIMKALGFLGQFADFDKNLQKISTEMFSFENSKIDQKDKQKEVVRTMDLNHYLPKRISSGFSLNKNLCQSLNRDGFSQDESEKAPTRGNSPNQSVEENFLRQDNME